MTISGVVQKKVECQYEIFSPRIPSSQMIVYLHSANAQEEAYSSWKNIPEKIRNNVHFLFPVASTNDTFRVESLYFLITEIAKLEKVKKIYGLGYSMGGRNLWDLCYEYPYLFNAIVTVAGYTSYLRASRLKSLPTWAICGNEDNVVPCIESKKMIGAMKSQGNKNARLTILKGVGHEVGPLVLDKECIYNWLLSH